MKDTVRRRSLFPKTLSQSVEQLVEPIYKKHGFAGHQIITHWEAIVGAELAAFATPQKLTFPPRKKEGGTLHIQVSNARALELQHMQPVILERIASYFGYPAVSRLAMVQSAAVFVRKETKTAVKRTGKQSAASAALVGECEDEDVRRALRALADTLGIVEN